MMAKRLPHMINWRGFVLTRNWDSEAGRLDEWRGYANLTHRGPSLSLVLRRARGQWRACLRTPDMLEPRVDLGLWGEPSKTGPDGALDNALAAWKALIERIGRGADGWAGAV